MYDYNGPMLWIVQYFHDSDKPADSLIAATDRVIARAQSQLVDKATLDRALVKIRSDLYANLEQFGGFGRANLLASFALFDDDPMRINRLETEFAKVTPALVQRTAREYLRKTNRTIYTIKPGAKADATSGGR
jgi:predicted Zn-dependent peptidase